jgi:hypothetical protein
MAITRVYYEILKAALLSGELPKDPSILELGEANFYGDMADWQPCERCKSADH